MSAGRRVVLVSAPAGSGKSTLVNGWMDEFPVTPGWLQIDEGDDDPARFWAYVAAALATSVPAGPDVVRASIGDGLEAAVAAFVNVIAAHGADVVLVLDDYHLIANDDVHHSVEHLISLRPVNLTIVISTRVDPPFRLGRLRVRDQLTEIRATDLRFDQVEAAWLLDAASTGLAPELVNRLHERTEGWAAGLVLASLSLRDGADANEFVDTFHGDDYLVADYLTDEFLDSIDTEERRRLLDVSILERLSGPLINEVCGVGDGTEWLARLASANQLVISLDRTGTWFRFHHLLRDLLRVELQRSAPERSVELHAAAGRWYVSAGELMPAVEHLLLAGRRLEAADSVAEHATPLLNIGRTYTVTRYIERLGDLVDTHAGLAIVHGWVSFVTGRFAEAERGLATAARLDVDGTNTGLIQALSAMSHLAKGDVASAIDAIDPHIAGAEAEVCMVLGGVRVMGGRFDEARPFLATARELALSRPDYFVGAVSQIFEAIAEAEVGRLVAARDLASSSIEYAEQHRISEAPQMALAHSIIARETSDAATAMLAARRGVQLARRSPEAVLLPYALASAADVAFEQQEPDAEALLAEARSIVDRCVDPGIAGRYLARVEARHGHADRPRIAHLVEDLSERELSVLRYLPSQLSQREIANELYVSLNTVKSHCKAIYRKLGVKGRKPAVQAARDHGLL